MICPWNDTKGSDCVRPCESLPFGANCVYINTAVVLGALGILCGCVALSVSCAHLKGASFLSRKLLAAVFFAAFFFQFLTWVFYVVSVDEGRPGQYKHDAYQYSFYLAIIASLLSLICVGLIGFSLKTTRAFLNNKTYPAEHHKIHDVRYVEPVAHSCLKISLNLSPGSLSSVFAVITGSIAWVLLFIALCTSGWQSGRNSKREHPSDVDGPAFAFLVLATLSYLGGLIGIIALILRVKKLPSAGPTAGTDDGTTPTSDSTALSEGPGISDGVSTNIFLAAVGLEMLGFILGLSAIVDLESKIDGDYARSEIGPSFVPAMMSSYFAAFTITTLYHFVGKNFGNPACTTTLIGIFLVVCASIPGFVIASTQDDYNF